MIHLNIKVFGSVQSVAFRYSAMKQAHLLGINGFVQNKNDGTVYIEAEGKKKILDQFLSWCRQGPEFAQVTRVDQTPGELKNFSEFIII